MMLWVKNAYITRRFQESEVEKVTRKGQGEEHTEKYVSSNDVKGAEL